MRHTGGKQTPTLAGLFKPLRAQITLKVSAPKMSTASIVLPLLQ